MSSNKVKEERRKAQLLEISTLTVQIENTTNDTKLKHEQLQSYRERLSAVRQEMLKTGLDNMRRRREIEKQRYARQMYIDGFRSKEHIDDDRKNYEREADLMNAFTSILYKVDHLTSLDTSLLKAEKSQSTQQKSNNHFDLNGMNRLQDVNPTHRQIEGPCVTVSYTSEMIKVFYIAANITFSDLLDEVKRFCKIPKEEVVFLVDNAGIICPNHGNVSECCLEWYGNSWLQREVKFFLLKRKENKNRNKDLSKHGSAKSTAEKLRIERRAREIMKMNNPFHDPWLKRMFGSRGNYMQSFVVYCVFLIIFAITCISRRDIQSEQNGIHAIKRAIKRNGGTFNEKLFDSISIEDDFWAWLQGPLCDILLPETLYSGAKVPPSLKGKINVYNKLAGPLRIRQLRVQKNDCGSRIINDVKSWTGGCYRHYNFRYRETSRADGWMNIPNATIFKSIPAITFKDSSLISGMESTLYGQSVMYDSSGWIMDFDVASHNRHSWTIIMKQLRHLKYIDQGTRAVVIDFNVYLPNTDKFISCNVLFEFTAGGAVISHLKAKSYVRADYDDYNQWGKLFLEFILSLFFVYYFKVEAERCLHYAIEQSGPPHYRSYLKSTLLFLSDFWNIIEVVLLGVYIASVAQRFILFSDSVRRLPLPWLNHVSLFARGEQYARAFKLDGILTLMVMIKTLKYAGLSTRFNLMRLTLVQSSPILVIYW